ncbi:DNA phosphorothioation-dependent restriction protein DptF [Bacillus sp. SB49]|uniref:DNA phosphorothioation-dependent restriction protein DptF n=1 Tax=Bacillus sp. SB49 TaxID=1071080 RepID=UPI0004194936|nr:DNA phosphorothioation-dependent restriction protein DptF [Bacillus sp. SB49]QHT48495.1 DNA phosphorothioation-dependent restriction protein DptF [Bacillus sp. SB49]
MQQQGAFCSFLEDFSENLYKIAQKVDDLVYVDATSAVFQGRKFTETLLKEIYIIEKDVKDERACPKLYDMLKELYREGVFSKKLQEDLEFLRLHGNKAAHDTRDHSLIASLKVHKKVFKLAGWYKEVYGSADFEMPKYEEPKPAQSLSEEHIQDLIKQHISKFTEGNLIPEARPQEGMETYEEESEITFEISEDLDENESYLIRELNRLKASSQEALENVGRFSKFKNYMHVERNIQFNLEKELENAKGETKKLVLLSGSVGDGKSHLLSYLTENKSELIKDFTIINDATESDSPEKSSLETLTDKLAGFSDEHYEEGNEKIILAINLGVLHNFISYEHSSHTFSKLEGFIKDSGLFSEEVTEVYSEDCLSIINFSDYQAFKLQETKAFSQYFDQIMNKITEVSKSNPFYQAFQSDLKKNVYTAVHLNYELLSNEQTQRILNKLLCSMILEDKVVISTRSFLNFLADILIPSNTDLEDIRIENMTEFERIEYSLPSLIFSNRGKSELIDRFYKYDPIHLRSKTLDKVINSIYSTNNFKKVVHENIGEKSYKKIFNPIIELLQESENSLEDEVFQSLTKCFLRAGYLTDPILQEELDNQYMKQYIRFLYGYNRGDKKIITEIYEKIRNVIFSWKGSPKRGYIYINNLSESYRVAQKLEYRPLLDTSKAQITHEEFESFSTTISLRFVGSMPSNDLCLEIDYPLFQLLSKVSDGYRPNKKDYEDGLSFITFMDQLISKSKNSDLLIHYHGEKDLFSLEKQFTGLFAFEKVED